MNIPLLQNIDQLKYLYSGSWCVSLFTKNWFYITWQFNLQADFGRTERVVVPLWGWGTGRWRWLLQYPILDVSKVRWPARYKILHFCLNNNFTQNTWVTVGHWSCGRVFAAHRSRFSVVRDSSQKWSRTSVLWKSQTRWLDDRLREHSIG